MFERRNAWKSTAAYLSTEASAATRNRENSLTTGFCSLAVSLSSTTSAPFSRSLLNVAAGTVLSQ
jgi:hypothetical protein